MLEFADVSGSYLGPAIARVVTDSIKFYEIKRKVISITVDNVSSNGTIYNVV